VTFDSEKIGQFSAGATSLVRDSISLRSEAKKEKRREQAGECRLGDVIQLVCLPRGGISQHPIDQQASGLPTTRKLETNAAPPGRRGISPYHVPIDRTEI
jgi:hypothetical protein